MFAQKLFQHVHFDFHLGRLELALSDVVSECRARQAKPDDTGRHDEDADNFFYEGGRRHVAVPDSCNRGHCKVKRCQV